MTPRSARSLPRSRASPWTTSSPGRVRPRNSTMPSSSSTARWRAPRRQPLVDHGAHRARARAELDDDRGARRRDDRGEHGRQPRRAGHDGTHRAGPAQERGEERPAVGGVGRQRLIGAHDVHRSLGGMTTGPARPRRRAAVLCAASADAHLGEHLADRAVEGEPGRRPVAAAAEPRGHPRHVDRALRPHRRRPALLADLLEHERDLGLGRGADGVDDAVDLGGPEAGDVGGGHGRVDEPEPARGVRLQHAAVEGAGQRGEPRERMGVQQRPHQRGGLDARLRRARRRGGGRPARPCGSPRCR